MQSFLADKDSGDIGKYGIIPIRVGNKMLDKVISKVDKDGFSEGSWYGNDTLWRTVLDLNRLLIYADRDGVVSPQIKRRTINIVDAIVAGEGEGPMEPTSRHCGLLLGGLNPAAVDMTLASLIGFDFQKIPLVQNAFHVDKLPLVQFTPEDVEVASNSRQWNSFNPSSAQNTLTFMPPSGWLGHVELSSPPPLANESDKNRR
jgi:hypothetical protein